VYGKKKQDSSESGKEMIYAREMRSRSLFGEDL